MRFVLDETMPTRSNYLFLIGLSLFKRGSKEDKKKGKGSKDKITAQQKEQAMELKSIIQEMVEELEYSQQSSGEVTPEGSEEQKDGEPHEDFSGRAKDIGDFESILQARRKELMAKLEKEREIRYNKAVNENRAIAEGNFMFKEYGPEGFAERPEDQHIPEEQPSVELDQDYQLPEQPKVRPTEQDVIEFDESKYFHERPSPRLISEKPIEVTPELEDKEPEVFEPGKPKEPEVKKKKGKKARAKKDIKKKARTKEIRKPDLTLESD